MWVCPLDGVQVAVICLTLMMLKPQVLKAVENIFCWRVWWLSNYCLYRLFEI
jgi:hypothetical protein